MSHPHPELSAPAPLPKGALRVIPLGGAGEIPAQFKELLEDKIAPGAGSIKSPLDDYREFYEFDVEIIRDDPLTAKPFEYTATGTGFVLTCPPGPGALATKTMDYRFEVTVRNAGK